MPKCRKRCANLGNTTKERWREIRHGTKRSVNTSSIQNDVIPNLQDIDHMNDIEALNEDNNNNNVDNIVNIFTIDNINLNNDSNSENEVVDDNFTENVRDQRKQNKYFNN